MSKWQPIRKSIAYSIEPAKARVVKALLAPMQWCQRHRSDFSSFRGMVALFLVGVTSSIAIASCTTGNIASSEGISQNNDREDVELTLASYSVTKAAHDRIIPKFVEQWKKEHNQNVNINQSYAASGPQADVVVGDFEADVVHLSLAIDIDKIVKAGLIEPGWEKETPNQGIVTKSVGAIATREGNPKNIKTWADLAKDGVRVITADPKTSGGARWNFLALWGSVTQTGGDENQALDFTTKVYKNAPPLPKSAREASYLFFKQGEGDVLLNYENEVILAEQDGKKLPYVVPDVNISIDNPVAVVDRNVDKHGTREVAEAFVKYMFSPEAQREFVKEGFRPVDPDVAKEVEGNFPKVKTLFTARDLGGCDEIKKKFFDDEAIFDKIKAKNNQLKSS